MALPNQLQAKNQSNRRRATRPLACLFPALTLLAACGNAEEEPALPPDVVEVPPLVQQMMDAEFPADGEIHVQSQGKITITPDTPVCEVVLAVPPEDSAGHFGVNSRPLFEPLGQSWGRRGGGGDRQISAAEPVCHEPGSVIIYGRKSDNRDGKPYKLVLAVWQDHPVAEVAVWIGKVERNPKGARPEIFNPYGADPLPLEIQADAKSLGKVLVSSISTGNR